MPHAGLIASTLSKEDELLLRAQLHVRGGRIRLSKGNYIDALAAFYDAFVSAMLRYAYSSVLSRKLNVRKNDDMAEDLSLFRAL
ncbi:MAG: hypothetical protein EAX95_02395 [Candidatus Thorarchaeota archaeon]|nr:hypothetical protein [Candidatus Thorarchaeota archaeon]